MSRKAVVEGGKRDEIIAASLKLFLEKGYENTSIRMIQKDVGSEVGLFYYYFKNKDEVFEKAIDLFFDNYKKDFSEIVRKGNVNPKYALTNFFEYVERETNVFRQKYSDKLHWTVRRAIREHTLEVIEPYLKQLVDMLIENGAKPPLNADMTAMFLTHGIGSVILHSDINKYISQRNEVIKGVNLLMGIDHKEYQIMVDLDNK